MSRPHYHEILEARIAELEQANAELCAALAESEASMRVWRSRAEQAEAAREAVREFGNTGGE